jgi:hypothetical protein
VTPRIVMIAAAVAALAGLSVAVSAANQTPPAPSPAASLDAGVAPELSSKVRIVFQTIPPEKATVMWGKKSIGLIKGKNKPLIIERPRDSGPMDVVIKTQGYLPVHTRAYTFTDSKLYVKLTLLEEKKNLFGYREALPDAGAPEAGAPPPPVSVGGGSRDAGAQ